MAFDRLVESMDRAVIGAFGGRVVADYAPAVGAPVPVRGVLERLTVGAAGSTVGVAMEVPSFFCRASDLTENPENRQDEPLLTITAPAAQAGRAFRSYEAHVDDEGGCRLLLREVTE